MDAQKEHDEKLREVLTRLQDAGLTLNGDKCQINMDYLIFMEMLLTEQGIGPTEERV